MTSLGPTYLRVLERWCVTEPSRLFNGIPSSAEHRWTRRSSWRAGVRWLIRWRRSAINVSVDAKVKPANCDRASFGSRVAGIACHTKGSEVGLARRTSAWSTFSGVLQLVGSWILTITRKWKCGEPARAADSGVVGTSWYPKVFGQWDTDQQRVAGT